MAEENKPSEQVKDLFSELITGAALSKAIFEDYCQVVGRLEGIPPSEVKARIESKTKENFAAIKAKVAS